MSWLAAPSLGHPEWAPVAAAGVALAAACAIVSWLVARRRARALLGSARLVRARRLARDLALVAALGALALAALAPRAGFETQLVGASGVDVVLLLDVSRSMDATDVPPSRLARAREIAAALLERLEPSDRAALAAFAGRGVLLTPLTSDGEALADLLPALDGELLQERSSDLGAGLAAALDAFEAASDRPRVVVALTDGEDPVAGRRLDDEAAKRAGARVVAVALGSDAGAALADSDGPLLDSAGRPVLSRRDTARLARLAERTDGAAFAGDRWGEIDLAAAIAAIRRDAGRSGAGELVPRRVAATRVAPLAAIAYALLWLEGLTPALASGRPRRRRLAALAWSPLAAIAALGLSSIGATPQGSAPPERPFRDPERAAAAIEARLRLRPGEPRLLIALGVARAQAARQDEAGQASLDEAGRALLAAALGASDPALSALAYYDLGVLALERHDLAAARDAFFDALALDPSDRQARFNLEWTLRALRAAPPPPPDGAGGEQQADRPERPQPRRPGEHGDTPPDHPRGPLPLPAAPGEAARDPARGFAPALDAQELTRWLDAVSDDVRHSLESAARAGPAPARPAAGTPQW